MLSYLLFYILLDVSFPYNKAMQTVKGTFHSNVWQNSLQKKKKTLKKKKARGLERKKILKISKSMTVHKIPN